MPPKKGYHLPMTPDKFTIDTATGALLCVKVFTDEDRFFFYILPYSNNHKGFFMTRGNNGKWEILYKILVDKAIVELEETLATVIEERLGPL